MGRASARHRRRCDNSIHVAGDIDRAPWTSAPRLFAEQNRVRDQQQSLRVSALRRNGRLSTCDRAIPIESETADRTTEAYQAKSQAARVMERVGNHTGARK